MSQASRHEPEALGVLGPLQTPAQLDLFSFVGDDDEHSCHAQDREAMSGGMYVFPSTIRQSNVYVLRRDLLARERSKYRSLLRRDRSPLIVAGQIVTPTLLE